MIRIDREGRDVTYLPGLWSEDDLEVHYGMSGNLFYRRPAGGWNASKCTSIDTLLIELNRSTQDDANKTPS